MVSDTILEIRNLTKLYPGVTALNNVNLKFERGEVHALCGENGAGKSTLIKTISGAIEPTSGKIILDGKEFDSFTPTTSRESGIAVVYQEFTLVPVLSAAENIFLGEFIRHGWICDQKAMNRRAAELFERLHIQLNPTEKVKDLTTGYQQIVEICKAVSKNAKLLIMDEPSAPLTTNEVNAMFEIVRMLKEQGVTVIYISHRLEEVFMLADRVSVLRDGCYVGTKNIGDTDKEDLIRMMVGRTLKETYPEHGQNIEDEVVLEAKKLTGNGVKDISFQLRKGEILSLGGLVGAGRTELAEMLFGSAPIKSGELYYHGRPIRVRKPSDSVGLGISFVPEDRKRHGLILSMSVKDNLTVTILKKLSKKMVVSKKKEAEHSEEYVESLGIKTPSIRQLVKNLSGGNQQKVVLGKWLGTNPDVLIIDEPTRGIDVGAKQEIYKLMMDIVKQGKSILMISSDMEELLGMSDRIIVLSRGRFVAEVSREEFSQETILRYSSESKI